MRRGWLFAPGVFLSVLRMKTGRSGNQTGLSEKGRAVRGFVPRRIFTYSGKELVVGLVVELVVGLVVENHTFSRSGIYLLR